MPTGGLFRRSGLRSATRAHPQRNGQQRRIRRLASDGGKPLRRIDRSSPCGVRRSCGGVLARRGERSPEGIPPRRVQFAKSPDATGIRAAGASARREHRWSSICSLLRRAANPWSSKLAIRRTTMDAKVIENERTAKSQHMTRQPDGPGKRIGKKGEISFIGKLVPGAAKLFRERLPQIQAEAPYWESKVGTLHDFRAALIDNDTRMLVTIVYDGDFKPYLEDVLREAGPWLDQIFDGWEGFRGTKDRKSVAELVA